MSQPSGGGFEVDSNALRREPASGDLVVSGLGKRTAYVRHAGGGEGGGRGWETSKNSGRRLAAGMIVSLEGGCGDMGNAALVNAARGAVEMRPGPCRVSG